MRAQINVSKLSLNCLRGSSTAARWGNNCYRLLGSLSGNQISVILLFRRLSHTNTTIGWCNMHGWWVCPTGLSCRFSHCMCVREFSSAGLWPGRPCLVLQLSNMLTLQLFWGPLETVCRWQSESEMINCCSPSVNATKAMWVFCLCIYSTLDKLLLKLWGLSELECLQNASVCVSPHAHPTELLSVPPKSGLNPVHLCPHNAKEFLLGLILLVDFSPLLKNSSSFFLFGFSSKTPPPLILFLSSHLSLVCSLLILLI